MSYYGFILFPRLRFSTFPLGQEVVSSLKAMGIETAFEIQAKTLPLTLEGK